MNIPTQLTILRIVLVIIISVLFFLPYENVAHIEVFSTTIPLVQLIIFILFLIASLTDFFDGYLARKWQQVTVVGTFLDSIADKLLTNITMLALIYPYQWLVGDVMRFPLWIVVIFIARDFLMDVLRTLAMQKGVVLSANQYGKYKTALQMISILLVLLNNAPFSFLPFNLTFVLIIITLGMSLLSLAIYVRQNRQLFQS